MSSACTEGALPLTLERLELIRLAREASATRRRCDGVPHRATLRAAAAGGPGLAPSRKPRHRRH